jgi:effector-binding domain-containing protein
LAIKDLGLSLDQVQRMMAEDVSADEVRGMFALKKAQLELTIREEVLQLQSIEARLNQMDGGGPLDDFDIVLKSVPEQSLIGLRDTFANFLEVSQLILEMKNSLPSSVSRKSLGPLTAIVHSEMFGSDTIDIEMGFVIPESLDSPVAFGHGREMMMRTLPAVETMVTAVRVGLPQTSFSCRGVMASWVENNGYRFSGHGREVFIVPPIPGREHEAVLEIQYPIAPAAEHRPLLN